MLKSCDVKFYDTKPLQYLSMVSYHLKLVVREKDVFDVDTGITETLRFFTDEYNS